MPYTVTEYAGGHGQVLATFARPSDAIAFAMRETVERLPANAGDFDVLYQGTRSDDDDAPWLVVEVVR